MFQFSEFVPRTERERLLQPIDAFPGYVFDNNNKNFISPRNGSKHKTKTHRENIYNRPLNYGKNIKTHILLDYLQAT